MTTETSNDLELFHYGIKGMKWGVRRKEGSDGTVSSAVKKDRPPGISAKQMRNYEKTQKLREAHAQGKSGSSSAWAKRWQSGMSRISEADGSAAKARFNVGKSMAASILIAGGAFAYSETAMELSPKVKAGRNVSLGILSGKQLVGGIYELASIQTKENHRVRMEDTEAVEKALRKQGKDPGLSLSESLRLEKESRKR